MKKTIIVSIVCGICFNIVFSNNALSWNHEVTHRDLSRYGSEASVLSKAKGDYLTNIGFTKGLDKEELTLNGKKLSIKDWLAEGAILEDAGTNQEAIDGKARFLNHFHNPVKQNPWDTAGLDDIVEFKPFGLFTIYKKSVKGESALVWAQDSAKQAVSVGGDQSWKAVRDYYYLALTSPSETDRQANFAKTFSGLGQQIHLIQDMAQPSHVRNDAHPEDALKEDPWLSWLGEERMEYWTKAHHSDKVLGFMKQPPVYPTFQPNTVLSSFWDSDQYDGTGNTISLTKGTTVGLAEYTNANYFSDDTINSPDARHQFPFPSTNIQDYYTCADNAPVGSKAAKRWYISRTPCQQGSIDHFLASSFLPKPQPDKISPSMLMDSRVYEDYAHELLPRAVGYSAGLLNYFFRGKLDMVEEGADYRIENLSDEEMTGNISSFRLFYDDANGNRQEMPLSFFGALGNQIADANIQLSISAKGKSAFTVRFNLPSVDPKSFLLVFKGKLGNEENAVVGSMIGRLYLMVMPVDHGTREILDSRYYSLNFIKGNTLASSTQSELPFAILDDGAYWDAATSTWSKTKSSESLGVPLGTGGPQYMAKHWDEQNNRLRFVPNLSYEKEAYHPFTLSPKDPATGQLIKNINYVTYIGSPLFSFGMYNENTGWMEYTDTGLMTIQPTLTDPQQRTFPLYKGNNFNDVFVETPSFKVYNFDGSRYETAIPKDPDAPKPSIIGAYIPKGENYVRVAVPNVYNGYIKPGSNWTNGTAGSSGFDYYRFQPNSTPAFDSHSDKCAAEDNNCGYTGGSSVNTVFDIPYNFNSSVRVHRNDNGQYYEELYINGQLVETSTASSEKLDVHYQILAVYKDTAVVRKTDYLSQSETPLPYQLYQSNIPTFRIYEKQRTFKSRYYIYAKGKRYDLTGTTDINTKYLNTPYEETPEPGTTQRVDYLTYEYTDDITGYHIDRIFISESAESGHILVAFDEYAYNNGKGLVHTRKYEPSDSDQSKHILYYDIPKTEIQNADHEATRTGRKLLLFRSDGEFKQSISDPIGLDKTMGSIGILN